MEGYKKQVEEKMDTFVQEVFFVVRNFPREEVYITTSQLKRAALSVVLNYIEGYARFKNKVQLNFLETSYGSLKEVQYLLKFSLQQHFLPQESYQTLMKQLDQIGAMLWTELNSLSHTIPE